MSPTSATSKDPQFEDIQREMRVQDAQMFPLCVYVRVCM